MEDKFKVCRDCKQRKPLSDFYKHPDTHDGTGAYCKECSHRRCRAQRKTPKGKEIWRAYRRKASLKRLYGISVDDYDRMFSEQGGKCAICGNRSGRSNIATLNVDHDSVSGKIRGLLCNRCNLGIGRFQHNIQILKKAHRYLSK